MCNSNSSECVCQREDNAASRGAAIPVDRSAGDFSWFARGRAEGVELERDRILKRLETEFGSPLGECSWGAHMFKGALVALIKNEPQNNENNKGDTNEKDTN
jgi:hypothetical protein